MNKINTMTNIALPSALAVLAMASMPQMLRAQATVPAVPTTFKVLDDFSKAGADGDRIDIITGNVTKSYTEPVKDINIIGGTRAYQLNVPTAGNNPYSQRIEVEVLPTPGNGLPPTFVWSVGYGGLARIDLAYGTGASKLVNLSGYDRIRVMFSGTSGQVDFDLVAIAGAKSLNTSCSLGVTPFAGPFALDVPLSAFRPQGLDFSDVTLLDFVLQSVGLGFGADLGITGIYAIPTGVVTDGPPGTPSGPPLYTCVAP
jgi:hypothetical protein